MELQTPQQPPTHIVREISQESFQLQNYDHDTLAQQSKDILQEINNKIARADEKKEQNSKELKQLLLMLNDKLVDASNHLVINATALTDIEKLKMTTSQQTVSIKQLEQQNSKPSNDLLQLKKDLATLSTQHNNVYTLSLLNAIGFGINFMLFLYVWYYTHK